MEDQISPARRHAVTASQLLVNLDNFAEEMRTIDPHRRLELIASGSVAQMNEDQKWTKDLAVAHALAALALHLTEPGS